MTKRIVREPVARYVDSPNTELVADIVRASAKVFGSESQAKAWLEEPNLALGGVALLQLLETEPGANQVRKVLAAIAHGGVV